MFECVVCGGRTKETVTLAGVNELIPLCGGRCRRVFIHDPLAYLGADMAARE